MASGFPPPSAPLISASRRLARRLSALSFSPPVRHAYNPLLYARRTYEAYVSKYANGRKRVVFIGMNPGPWGMAQTGVPFGVVETVRGWLKISGRVDTPVGTHPRLPVLGFDCHRSEVSGRRLWALFRERFDTADRFFRDQFVTNYCPLLFLDEAGRNLTPDKLKRKDRELLFPLLDEHLLSIIEALQPQWIVGIGRFAEARVRTLAESAGLSTVKTAGIHHPSPANPQANRDWGARALRALEDLGVW